MIKDIKNHIKINDFSSLLTDFEKLSETIDKSSHFLWENQREEILPLFILRAIAHIDNSINDVTNEQKKKFSQNTSKAYNKLKQKFKKYLSSTGPTENNFEKQLNDFKAKPIWSEDEKKDLKKDKKKEEKKTDKKGAKK